MNRLVIFVDLDADKDMYYIQKYIIYESADFAILA